MEAVNKAINTASTAIWGDQATQPQSTTAQEHTEPISGVQGKGIASDPYDAGNREEQPNAPVTDANTAPQEPRLDGQPQNASAAGPTTGSTTENSVPNLAAGGTTGASAAGSIRASTSTNIYTTTDTDPSAASTEQEQTGRLSGRDRVQAVMSEHHVSIEALQGPQGPPPKSAEEFEKGLMKVVKDAEAAESAESTKKAQKAHHGNGMSKMKETLSKVTHPRHNERH